MAFEPSVRQIFRRVFSSSLNALKTTISQDSSNPVVQSFILYSDYQATLADTESIDSGWLDMGSVDKVQISGYGSSAGMTLDIQSRADENQASLDTSTLYNESSFFMFNIICRQRYMRFKWRNTTGDAITNVSLEVKASYGSSDKLSVFPLSIGFSDFSQAALVQSVIRGQQPDGDYVAIPTDGMALESTTTLAGNQLNGALNDTSTTVTVDSTTGFPSTGYIKINDEIISYTGVTATTFTGCVRGAEGTESESHLDNEIVGGVYISAWVDSDGWNSLELFLKSDVVSSFLGVQIEFTDNTSAGTPTIRGKKSYTFSLADIENDFKALRTQTLLDGFRVKYANAGTTQSVFYLSATLRTQSENILFNKGGGLLTASFETEVALGLVSNYEIDTKFGRVKGIDAADNAVDIWAFADDGLSPRANTKTFPTTASTFYLASSSSSDTDVDVTIEYIDSLGFAKTTTVNLNGQTGVSLGDTALDVNRMYVSGATAAVGRVYCVTANNFTAGVPATPSQCLGFIDNGDGQTKLTHFTVPAKKKLIIKGYLIHISRAKGDPGSADITLRIKEFGKTSIIKREFFPTTSSQINRTGANIVVPARSQVVWRLDDASDMDTQCTCSWDYELIDD